MFLAFGVLAYPPRRMELANSRFEKNVIISQEKLGSRVVQVEKLHIPVFGGPYMY